MINIEKIDKSFWACNSCLKTGEETTVYNISLAIQDENMNGSASSSFRLCKDCLKELNAKSQELIES